MKALFLLAALFAVSAEAQVISVPTQTTNTDMLLVGVKINGADYLLLVDTGAAHSIIGEAGVGKSRPKDSSRGLMVEANARLVTMEIPGLPAWKMHVLSTNLTDFSKRFGTWRVDGILGQDVLRKFRSVRINYAKSTIELER